MKTSFKIILLISFIFISTQKAAGTSLPLSKINFEKIKTLELEFKNKAKNFALTKKAIIAAGAIAIGALVAREFLFKPVPLALKPVESQIFTSEQLKSKELDIRLKELALIKESDNIVYRFKNHIIDSLLAGSTIYMISKSFDDIKKWWQSKSDLETFHLNESINNLQSLTHFLVGVCELKNNTSYKTFYLNQIAKTHNLFISAIENLIAATSAKDSSCQEWLHNENNGLILEINILTKYLEENIFQNNESNLNQRQIQPLVENLISCLKRFKKDFNNAKK